MSEVFPPNILSVRNLAHKIGFDLTVIRDIANTAGRYYRPYPQRKGDKVRWIDNPFGILKELQKRIEHRLLSKIAFPHYLHGGIAGRSPITNASSHQRAFLVVTLDIRKCFPSISNIAVFRAWTNILGCSPSVAHILTKLTTFEGHLPQGAPTSTTLANVVLTTCDDEIRTVCDRSEVTYTRYVDDLIFSGNQARSVINEVVRLLKKRGFRSPHAKQHIMGPHKCHEITGVVVNSTPGVSRKRKSRIRAAIHQLKFINDPREREKAMLSLRGKIGFVNQVNTGSARSLNKLLNVTCSVGQVGDPGLQRFGKEHKTGVRSLVSSPSTPASFL